ncbi:MAG: glycosyltransferase [Bacteroidia bacterium]|nr:MAG: glycosyltransferase [Bacteroidia bacterium]
MKKLSVIVVIYNEIEEFKKCFRSITKNKIQNMEIVVVDNGEDKEKEIRRIGKNIKYIRSGGNIGFGNAANVGIKKTKSEYVLILTPDIELFPNTIKKTVEYIGENKKVGFVTCGLFAAPKKISHSIYRKFPNILSTIFEYNYPFYFLVNKINPDYHPILMPVKNLNIAQSVEHVTGAYIMLRRKMLDEIGVFDKQFTFYREETDLCRRIKEQGWEIHFVPFGGVYHSGAGALHQKLTQSNNYYLSSTYKYFNKYNGKIFMIFIWIVIFISSIMSVIFLIPVVSLKKLFGKKAKTEFLLGEWLKILSWHLKNLSIFSI